MDDRLKRAIAPVAEMARQLTGVSEIWTDQYMYGEPPEWYVYFVLPTNVQLQGASDSGVTDRITDATIRALISTEIPFRDFSRRRVTYTTQQYCDEVYNGDWHSYFS